MQLRHALRRSVVEVLLEIKQQRCNVMINDFFMLSIYFQHEIKINNIILCIQNYFFCIIRLFDLNEKGLLVRLQNRQVDRVENKIKQFEGKMIDPSSQPQRANEVIVNTNNKIGLLAN